MFEDFGVTGRTSIVSGYNKRSHVLLGKTINAISRVSSQVLIHSSHA